MNTRALERLIAETAPDLLRYFERRVPVRADAADYVSETLLVLWRDRDRIPGVAHDARLWMFGVARTVLTAGRRHSFRRDAVVDAVRSAIGRDEHPDLATQSDLALDVRAAIGRLPEAQREVVQLHHWEGLPLVDVAVVTGASASTVRSRYAAARASLAHILADHQVTT